MLLFVMIVLAMMVVSLKYIWLDGFSLRSLDFSQQWYFMYCYLVIFMLSPFIGGGIELLSRKQLDILLGVLIGFQIYSFIRCPEYGVENLLIMYLLGGYCSKYNITLTSKKAFCLFVVSFAAVFALEFFVSQTPIPAECRILSYKSPLIMLMAGSLFFVFLNFKSRSIEWLNACLRPCLFIFLLTEGIGMPLYKSVTKIFASNFIYGIFASSGIILFCLAVGFVLDKVARYTIDIIFKNHKLRTLNEQYR